MKFIKVITHKKKPEAQVLVRKVKKGVYFIICDFLDRYQLSATGSDNENELELYFSKGEEILFSILFEVNESGYLFGEVSKQAYYGTFYEYPTYKKMIEGGNNEKE